MFDKNRRSLLIVGVIQFVVFLVLYFLTKTDYFGDFAYLLMAMVPLLAGIHLSDIVHGVPHFGAQMTYFFVYLIGDTIGICFVYFGAYILSRVV